MNADIPFAVEFFQAGNVYLGEKSIGKCFALLQGSYEALLLKIH
jgi:hypothetical protein